MARKLPLFILGFFFLLEGLYAQNVKEYFDSITIVSNQFKPEDIQTQLASVNEHFHIQWSDSLEQRVLFLLANDAILSYDYERGKSFMEMVSYDFFNEQKEAGAYWNKKAHYIFYTGSLDTSIVWANKAYDACIEEGDDEGVCEALNGLALAYERLGDFQAKIDYLNELIAFAEKHGLERQRAAGIFNLGNSYETTGYYEEAINNYKIVLLSQNFDRVRIAALNALGNSYLSLHLLDSARFYFEKSMDANNGQDMLNYAYALGGLGNVCLKEEKDVKAKDYLLKGHTIFKSLGDPFYIAYSGGEVGQAYLNLDMLDSSIYYSKNTYDFLLQVKQWDELVKSAKFLALAYGGKGELDSVDFYVDRALEFRDSLSYAEQRFKIGEQLASIELKEKELQLANERAENEKAEKEKVFAYLGLISLLVIIALLLVFAFNLKKLNLKLKNGEQQLANKNDLLNELNRNNDKLLTIIAHDVRGPLASLKELLEIASGELPVTEKDEIIKLSRESSETTYKLIDELLDWARLDKGLDKFEKEPVDVKPFVEKILGMYKVQASSKKVELINAASSGCVVSADRQMFSTILRNLITNAIKFTNKDGFVKVDCAEEENAMVIHVSDSGVGMTPEEIDSFYKQGDFSKLGTENEIGSGMGNKLVHMMVEQHGGSLKIQSTIGVGTTVSVHFPKV